MPDKIDDLAIQINELQIDALLKKAQDLRTVDVMQALKLGEQTASAAREHNYRPGLAKSLAILAFCNYRLADYELARVQSSEALGHFIDLSDKEGQADVHNTIGNIHFELGDLSTALNYYLKSLGLRREINNKQGEAASLNNIGNVHYHLGDYSNALDSHLKSLHIKKAIKDETGVANSLNNLGHVYKKMQEHQKALGKYEESLAIINKLNNKFGKAGVLSSIGEMHLELANPLMALEYLRRSLEIEQATGNRHGEAESLLQLGEIYLKNPDLKILPDRAKDGREAAFEYFQKAVNLAEEINAAELIYRAHSDLSKYYQETGDFVRALEHYQAFHAIQNKFIDAELIEQTSKLEIIHQVEASRQEADIQRMEAEVLRLKHIELHAQSKELDMALGESRRTEKELLRRNQQLAAAAEVARITTSTLDLVKLFTTSVKIIREKFNFYHASVFLTDPDTNMAILKGSTGETGRKLIAGNFQLAIGSNSLVGLATSSRQPVVVQDVRGDPTHFKNPLLPDTHAEAVIPLLSGEIVVGALDVQSTNIDAFSESDVTLLVTIADQLTVAIENARLYDSAQKELAERKRAEQALQDARDALEITVQERTVELRDVNEHLRIELTQRRQVEAELEKSLSTLQATIESTTDGILVVDQHGKITSFNQRFVEMWHIPSTIIKSGKDDQALAFVLDQLVDPGAFKAKVQELYSQLEAESFDILQFKDRRVFERYSRPQKAADQNVGRVWSFRDVTERKQAEEALREAEIKYRMLVERLPVVVYTSELGLSGIWHYVSPQIEQLLGFTAEEWMGDPELWYRQVHPEDRDRQEALEEQAYARGEPFVGEYRMNTREGDEIWIRDSAQILPPQNNSAPIVQGILMDISGRKQAEVAAREAETKFRTLVEQIPAIIYMASLDKTRPTLYISPQIEAVLGFAPEEWLADPELWGKQLHPDDRERVLAIDKHTHTTGEPFVAEYRIFTKDGHVRWLHDETHWVRDETGQPQFTLGIEFDITEHKQAEMLQEVVYQIAQATNQELGLDELATTIHQSIQKVMLADNFYIALLDAKTDMIGYLYAVDQFDEEFSLAKSGKSLTAYILRTGKSLLATEAVYQELLDAGEVELVGAPSPIWLGVPLNIQGKAIGVMVVQDYQNERAYGEREKQLLEYVSSQVAISIQQKQAEDNLRVSEEHFRSLYENTALGMYRTTPDGQILLANPALVNMLGYSSLAELNQRDLEQEGYEPGYERTIFRQQIESSGLIIGLESAWTKKDGTTIFVRESARAIQDTEGKVVYYEGTVEDITERKQAEMLQEVVYQIAQATTQELSLNELFATIHGSIQKVMLADNFYIAMYDSKSDILSFPYAVDQFEKDFSTVKLGRGMTAYVLRTGQSLLCTPAVHQKLMETGEIEVVGAPSLIWLGVPLKIHGETIGAMAVQDYSNETAYGQREKQILEYVSSQVAMSIQRKRAEERLAHDALHDALTGLPNRALFLDRLEHAIKKTGRSVEDAFAVLFLDIDRFKLVNDSLGHACGDQLLIEIGKRLKTCLRPGDTVARLGGDEFAIILDEINKPTDATYVANRIQENLAIPFNLNDHHLSTSASIGIMLSRPGYNNADEMLRDADTAMYRAKTTGKARHEIFDTGMHAAVTSLLQLETDLRNAIANNEFRVYYQPLVSMKDHKVVGTEALLRWQHPERGLLPPSAFISVLEETGMIVPVGKWVLQTACEQNKLWQNIGNPQLRIAVNFSARQFQIKNLVDMVRDVLQQTAMDPKTLELEITESTAIQNTDLTLKTLKELHDLGVSISLDDFGSGYSALGYLSRYPFQSLKADRSFIMDIPNDSNDMAITSAIIAMAHSLKIRVVAEGVETVEQLEFLRSNNCDEVQGFLFSHPVPTEELSRLLLKKNLLPVSKTKGKKAKK